MSKAENLLNSLNTPSGLANESEEPHIVIGYDRVVTVPDQLKRLAVQHDHDVETVTFDCPRYWDEHDMSQMSVYINYLRSDTYQAAYKVPTVTVDANNSSIMHFDWTISRNVSSVTGKIVFLVCVKKTDADGNESNHWNSELCKDCYVSEGLEPNAEELKEAYPDIIEQWHQELLDRVDAGDFNGVTFTPSISDDGVLSWTNDGGKDNPKPLKINSITFTPSVSSDGVLSWTNDGDKPNPSPVKVSGVTFTPSISADGTLSWTNDGGKPNPSSIKVNGITFTPSISEDGILSWTNDGGKPNPSSIKVNGVTYTPSISNDGVLSWTNDGGKENPQSLSIRNGVSPTIEVSDIQGGHRVTIKSWSGDYETGSLVTQTFDVKDASIDTSETVTTMLNNLIYLGGTEPTTTPVLWLDTRE